LWVKRVFFKKTGIEERGKPRCAGAIGRRGGERGEKHRKVIREIQVDTRAVWEGKTLEKGATEREKPSGDARGGAAK